MKLNQQFFECKPSKLPPFEFWVGRPATKNVVLSNYYSPNIEDKWTMCISNTCCSKLKFVISSYLQIEISTHPNQILPIKLKVNKQLWNIADFNKGNFKLKVMWLIYENDLKLVYSKREIVCKYKSISVRSWQTKTDLDLRNAATFRKITSNYFYSTKLG